MTYIDPTHLLLPLPTSPGSYLAASGWKVGGGGGGGGWQPNLV